MALAAFIRVDTTVFPLRKIMWLPLVLFWTGCMSSGPGWVEISADGKGFLCDGRPLLLWGFNYDRTRIDGRDVLLEEVLAEQPERVSGDFRRMRDLGGNTVRLFCQMGSYFEGPGVIRPAAFAQLDQALEAAEQAGLHVLLVGLNHICPASVPAWLVEADDATLLIHQKLFWEALARRYRHRPVILAYDLINEPAIPADDTRDLVVGCFDMSAGRRFCYVHHPLREIRGRWRRWVHGRFADEDGLRRCWPDYPRPGEDWNHLSLPRPEADDPRFGSLIAFHAELLTGWAGEMIRAIREHDRRHLITVGALNPGVFAGLVDFHCLHLYPRAEASLEENRHSWEAEIRALPPGKPVVIEEFYPIAYPADGAGGDIHDRLLSELLNATQSRATGYLSFYWGPARELFDRPLQQRLYESWLEVWSRGGRRMARVP